jgi:hypothetical protein
MVANLNPSDKAHVVMARCVSVRIDTIESSVSLGRVRQIYSTSPWDNAGANPTIKRSPLASQWNSLIEEPSDRASI